MRIVIAEVLMSLNIGWDQILFARYAYMSKVLDIPVEFEVHIYDPFYYW